MGDQLLNPMFSSARAVVAHVSAGVKGCRSVKEVLRLTTVGIADLVRELACGLPNLRVRCRHPLPTVKVLRLLSSA